MFFLFHSSLKKSVDERSTYRDLLLHPFLQRSETQEVDMASYVTSVLERHGIPEGESNQ